MNYRIWTITVLLALGTGAVTLRGTGQVHPLVQKSHLDGTGSVFTSHGKVRVDLRAVLTEIEGTKGPIAVSVLVIRDPNSGAYSWRVHTAEPTDPFWRMKQFNDTQAIFLKNDKFTDFMVLPIPLRLFVHQYSGRTSNMNEAVDKSLRKASESLHPFGDVETMQGIRVVSLSAVGRDFTSKSMSEIGSEVMPKVSNVQWDGKHWTVTLKARWIEKIILDSDFDLISMRKIGSDEKMP